MGVGVGDDGANTRKCLFDVFVIVDSDSRSRYHSKKKKQKKKKKKKTTTKKHNNKKLRVYLGKVPYYGSQICQDTG